MTQGMIGDRPYSVEDRIFIPKDIKTKSILAPIENFDNVKAFLAENNIEIPVIGNTALENA